MGWVSMRRDRLSRRIASIGIAVSLVGGTVAVMAEPAAAAPAWSIKTSPTPAGTPLSSFSNIACASTTLCFAVGQYTFDFDRTQAMVKKWNGANWTLSPVPAPAGATSTSLTGVRCRSATSCFAVGNYRTQTATRTFILRWVNTSGWTIMASPTPAGTVDVNLTSIACPSATSCFAVGQYDNGFASRTLVERWNGTAWTIMASPTGAGASDSHLNGVACPSVTSCFAVGDFLTATAQKTLVLRFNGTAWALSASPNPAGNSAQFGGIACPTTTVCYAVGGYSGGADKTLVEKWNGTAWAIMASPNATGTYSVLHSVACASATSCMAAGDSITQAQRTLTIRLTGATWALVASPNPAGTTDSQLSGIACVGGAFCMAVGGSVLTSSLNPLVVKWNGSAWAVSPTPGLASTGYGILNGVTCLSAVLCWSVGEFNTGFFTRTTSARWNGTTWTTVTPKNPAGAQSSKLNGLACVNANFCIAVGSTTVGAVEKTLIERWNGTAWSILASPNVSGAESNTLSGVACPTATSCFAVGSYVKAGVTKSLGQRWNGTTWTTQVTPNPAGADPVAFKSVACPSTTVCFAAGQTNDLKSFFAKWNGTAWGGMASPNPAGTVLLEMNGISCPSTTSCFAVGKYTSGTTTKTLIERLTGATWAVMASPNPAGSTDAVLSGVSCPSPVACFAVGRFATASAGNKTLVQRWTGTTWGIVSSPNPATTTGSELNAVRCQSAAICFAVGDNRVVANRRSLIEHWA
jgi:hypothetical protein